MINIPLWLVVLLLILLLYVGWKIVKFALKIFLVALLSLIAVLAMDYFQIFDLIKHLLMGS